MGISRLVVLVDADNTLWDTDSVFRDAQLLLLRLVEHAVGEVSSATDRLDFVRSYDQALAQAHHLRLRYPPQLLVRGIEAALSGFSPESAARSAITGRAPVKDALPGITVDALVADYMAALTVTPKLLPSVAEAVLAARDSGLRLYVMTEGRIDKQKRLLDAYKMHDSFDGVWELTKNRAQFARMLQRFPDQRVIVIGDQLDRDIIPAKEAGCSTVFVPGRFTPSWNRERRMDETDYVATDLLAAITWCIESFKEEHTAIR